jgi:hypothetical protein
MPLLPYSVFHSYFQFSISHTDKHEYPCFDLSEDGKAEVSPENLGFSKVQLSLETVIMRTLQEYDVSVEVDEHI